MSKETTGQTGQTGHLLVEAAKNSLLFLMPEEIAEPEITNVRPYSSVHVDERELAELDALGKSLAKGQIQPVLVSLVDGAVDGQPKYNLIAGRRRKKAVEMYNMGLAEGVAPLKLIAMLTDDDTDERMFQQAAHENIQRRPPNARDFAENIRRVKSTYKTGTKAADARKRLAKFFGVSEAQITTHESLLELPEEVLDKVGAGVLSADDALKLVKVVKKEGAAKAVEVAAAAVAAEEEVLAAADREEDEAAAAAALKGEGGGIPADSPEALTAPTTAAGKAKKKKAKAAKSAVIDAAARAAGDTTQRSKKQILEFFEGCQGPAYGYVDGAVFQFVEKLLEYAAGTTTDRTLAKYFDAMVEKAPKGTQAAQKEAEAKEKAAKEVVAAKAVKKPKGKKADKAAKATKKKK